MFGEKGRPMLSDPPQDTPGGYSAFLKVSISPHKFAVKFLSD